MKWLFKSSMSKWGGQTKTTKQKIQDFMIWELQGIKIIKQKFKVLKICLAYWGFAKCLF